MTKDSESFDDVFARDGSDMGADTAAPVTTEQPRDDAGRFATKEEAPPPPAPEAKAATPTEPQAPPPDSDFRRQVPLPELLSEREKRKAEATRREEAEKRAEALQAQIDNYNAWMRQNQQQQPQQNREEQPPPDPWQDPAGAFQYQQNLIIQQQQHFDARLADMRANFSEARARDKFGDEAVEAAQKAALQAGYGQYFLRQQDPYGELLKWHRQNSFLSKVGADPDAYEKSIEQRAYERALADLRAGKAAPGGTPSQPTQAAPQRFPGSLADATAAGKQGAVLTDEAIAADIFDANRKDRRMLG